MKVTTVSGQTLRNHFPITQEQAKDIELDFARWKAQFNCPAVITIVLHSEQYFDVHINAVMKRDIAVGHFILGLVLLPYVTEFIKSKNQIAL